jgi:hypothetical protein
LSIRSFERRSRTRSSSRLSLSREPLGDGEEGLGREQEVDVLERQHAAAIDPHDLVTPARRQLRVDPDLDIDPFERAGSEVPDFDELDHRDSVLLQGEVDTPVVLDADREGRRSVSRSGST